MSFLGSDSAEGAAHNKRQCVSPCTGVGWGAFVTVLCVLQEHPHCLICGEAGWCALWTGVHRERGSRGALNGPQHDRGLGELLAVEAHAARMHVGHYRQVQAPAGASECLCRSAGAYVVGMSEEEIRNLERRGPELVYMAVADDIAGRISRGELVSGDKLPGELDMVATYGIARMTASRAVRELRERGLVQTVRGKGTFVL